MQRWHVCMYSILHSTLGSRLTPCLQKDSRRVVARRGGCYLSSPQIRLQHPGHETRGKKGKAGKRPLYCFGSNFTDLKDFISHAKLAILSASCKSSHEEFISLFVHSVNLQMRQEKKRSDASQLVPVCLRPMFFVDCLGPPGC